MLWVKNILVFFSTWNSDYFSDKESHSEHSGLNCKFIVMETILWFQITANKLEQHFRDLVQAIFQEDIYENNNFNFVLTLCFLE